jgi:hypothetical protein
MAGEEQVSEAIRTRLGVATRFERETHEAGRIEAAALEPAARLEFGVADARHTDPRG